MYSEKINSKRILIVSYKLGTTNGVGGRRWLNYGLELIKQGYHVFFLTYQQNIPEELVDYKDRVYIIRGNYPEILNRIPNTIIEKLSYRFYLYFLNIWNKGNAFDPAIRTKKQFVNLIEKIIDDHGISHLIISGAPFSLLYFGTLIKKKYSNIKLISDYRDAWTNGIGYGIPNLPKRKLKQELVYEKEVLRVSDKIIVASQDILLSIKQIANDINPLLLPNFVNPITFHGYTMSPKDIRSDNLIYITHIGSVNQGTDIYWQHFLDKIYVFNSLNNKNIKCRFIGGQLLNVKKYVIQNNYSFVEFLPYSMNEKLLEYMSESDLFVLFKNNNFPNSFPTKFFDYLCFKKPILCYSIDGLVTHEINENRIGEILHEKINQKEFNNIIIQSHIMDNYNLNYDYAKFNLSNLTKIIIEDVLI